MQKRDFVSYQKRFRDFEILPKFSESHVFRGTIRHPLLRRLDLFSWSSSSFLFAGTLSPRSLPFGRWSRVEGKWSRVEGN